MDQVVPGVIVKRPDPIKRLIQMGNGVAAHEQADQETPQEKA